MSLYFTGEIIDVDAYTGGFNLTIAFSTAMLLLRMRVSNMYQIIGGENSILSRIQEMDYGGLLKDISYYDNSTCICSGFLMSPIEQALTDDSLTAELLSCGICYCSG